MGRKDSNQTKKTSFTNFDHVPTRLIEFERILQEVVQTSWSLPECEWGLKEEKLDMNLVNF